MKLSRRTFGAALGAAAPLFSQQGTAPNPNTSQQRRGTLPEVAPFRDKLEFMRRPAPIKVRPFPMTQVRITGGAYKQAEEWNRGYMHRLGADRLIHNFRLNAGLPSSATPLGGWEQYGNGREAELRGHFTGHYLSAAALLHASTGDKEIKDKADSMVEELAKCQQKLGGGYLSAFPTEWFDRLAARTRVWAPYYTVHKIMAGMLDMYRYAGNKQALQVLEKMSGWVDEWTASKPEDHMQNILETEYGGMNELFYDLAGVTGNSHWAEVGDRFTKKRFFNPLALRRDEMRGLHVNTHIPQVLGAARRYELSSDMRFHDVADFFWYEITSARAYSTGGTSNGEGWLAGPRELAAEWKQSVATAECCCAYNMMKLTRQLYSWTADPRYFDYYERTLLNHRLGTIQPKTGATQYYLSHTPGAWKTFNTEDKSFWCCTGTGVEEFAKLNDSIYWQDDEGLYVNLFVPSQLDWKEKGIRLRQETAFPEKPQTLLTFSIAQPAQLTVRLRIPAWVESGASVKVNGTPLDALASPGSYLVLARTWKDGDRIEMNLPMRLHTEAMPDAANLQAFLYGPIVLAGDLGADGLTPEMIVGPSAPRVRTGAEAPSLRVMPKAADAPLTFRSGDYKLSPLNGIFDKRYTIYWQIEPGFPAG